MRFGRPLAVADQLTDPLSRAHERLRSAIRTVGIDVHLNVPPGREHALALTKLEEALFWAGAGISRDGVKTIRSEDGTIIATNDPPPPPETVARPVAMA